MGIYKQPGKWECGPFALKHALLMRGILASEWEIARLAGATPDGTDEAQLEHAARQFGCELPTIRELEPENARQKLVSYLHDGTPCLLCIDGWDHWVTALHEEAGQFIVLDSEKPEVITIIDWPRLRKLWTYIEHDGGRTRSIFDLHPLIPTDDAPTKARFSLEWAQALRRPENRGLAGLWDVYVEDLITICDGQASEYEDHPSIPLGELIGRQEIMLLDQLERWHGRLDREAARLVVERMRFVADTYGLAVRHNDQDRTIAGLSMILAFWSAGEFGVEPIYRRVPIRKIR
jgi:hypothetical protein